MATRRGAASPGRIYRWGDRHHRHEQQRGQKQPTPDLQNNNIRLHRELNYVRWDKIARLLLSRTTTRTYGTFRTSGKKERLLARNDRSKTRFFAWHAHGEERGRVWLGAKMPMKK